MGVSVFDSFCLKMMKLIFATRWPPIPVRGGVISCKPPKKGTHLQCIAAPSTGCLGPTLHVNTSGSAGRWLVGCGMRRWCPSLERGRHLWIVNETETGWDFRSDGFLVYCFKLWFFKYFFSFHQPKLFWKWMIRWVENTNWFRLRWVDEQGDNQID